MANMANIDPEVFVGRLGFADAQAAMEGAGIRYGDPNVTYRLGWQDTAIGVQVGSFCIVHENGPLGDLVGDYLRLSVPNGASVLAYCVASGDFDTQGYDIAVTRRLFAAVESLTVQRVEITVEVLE